MELEKEIMILLGITIIILGILHIITLQNINYLKTENQELSGEDYYNAKYDIKYCMNEERFEKYPNIAFTDEEIKCIYEKLGEKG